MSKPMLWEKKEKYMYFKMLSAEIFPEYAKR